MYVFSINPQGIFRFFLLRTVIASDQRSDSKQAENW